MGTCHGKQQVPKENSIYRSQFELLIANDEDGQTSTITLEQAILPLLPYLPTIQTYARIAKDRCQDPADNLTSDQSASIMLYSMGWQPLDECLYVVLNATLRTITREKLQPWFLYLKLLLAATRRLPSVHLTVYRDSQIDLSRQYHKDETVFWWDFSLCTTSIEQSPSERCSENFQTKTLFSIECHSIKDIRKHTYFQSDNLVLILPGTELQVTNCSSEVDNRHFVTLQESRASFLLSVSSVKSNKFFLKLCSCSKTHSSRRHSSLPKNTSLEQLIAESGRGWTVDLDERNLTDRDMKTVVKHAIIKNRCKRIRLRDNHITAQGASVLAESLNNNTILESLDLRNNYIADSGVQSLALTIAHSSLKTLNLESNGITADGAQYLARMLNYNRTLTELYLSKNHLGDRGVEWLTHALNEEKKGHHELETRGQCSSNLSTLQHLYLGQNDITDFGVEYLADMLKSNRMLTWLWLSGNEIGDRGVELLAHTLAYHNLTLEWLFLNSNKAISDASVDALITMLKRNHSLKTMYINNCNLSDDAKQKLRETTKLKKDFDLEV